MAKAPKYIFTKPARIETPTTVCAAWTEAEAQDASHRIRQAWRGFQKDWRAMHGMLVDFRDHQGWKALGYQTLAGWMGKQLGVSRSYSYRMIDGADTYARLSPMGDDLLLDAGKGPVLPSNERQIRPLIKLPAKLQRVAWERSVKRAAAEANSDEFDVSERIVREVVAEVLPKTKRKPRPAEVKLDLILEVTALVEKAAEAARGLGDMQLTVILDEAVARCRAIKTPTITDEEIPF